MANRLSLATPQPASCVFYSADFEESLMDEFMPWRRPASQSAASTGVNKPIQAKYNVPVKNSQITVIRPVSGKENRTGNGTSVEELLDAYYGTKPCSSSKSVSDDDDIENIYDSRTSFFSKSFRPSKKISPIKKQQGGIVKRNHQSESKNSSMKTVSYQEYKEWKNNFMFAK